MIDATFNARTDLEHFARSQARQRTREFDDFDRLFDFRCSLIDRFSILFVNQLG
jgi:hypothetical protein